MLGNGITPHAFKTAVAEWVAINHAQPTSYELTNLYNTSALCYRAANFWADNVVAPKYVAHFNGEPVEDDDPRDLPRLIRKPSFKRSLWHKSVTESFWGRDLTLIVLNFFSDPIDLHWINPNMYGLFYSMEGLRPFWVYQSSRFEPIPESGIPGDERRIPLEQAVYTHLLDFRNDYDGTAPAEVAFLQASAGVEMAQTWNATFKNLAIPAAIVQPPADDKAAKARDNNIVLQLINRLREIAQGARNAGRTLVSPHRWEWITLQPPFKDMDFSAIDSAVKEAVATAFAVNIEFFTTGQTNYAELEGKIKLWRENTLKPRCEHYAQEYTEQLAHPYYGREWSIVADFSKILPENENEKLETVGNKLSKLLITIDKAQEEMGLEVDPRLKGFYLIGDAPVPPNEIRDYWRNKQLIAPSVFNADLMRPDGEPPPQPVDPNAPPAVPMATANPASLNGSALNGVTGIDTAAKDVDTSEVWVGLSLTNDPYLIDLQRKVKVLYGDTPFEWTAPDDYHVTLFYSPTATDEQARALATAVREMEAPELELRIGSLRTFDDVGRHALHFRIRRNEDLEDFQESVYNAAIELGIQPSPFSIPGGYIPHVTMGYAQVKPRAQTFGGKATVKPTRMEVSSDDTELARIPLTEDDPTVAPAAPVADLASRELTQWREKIKRKGVVKGLDFKCEYVSAGVWHYIYNALSNNPQATNALINAVFTKAKEKLPADEPEGSLTDFASPEEYERYWSNYDRLMAEVGNEWISVYMQKAWQSLAKRLSKNTDKAEVKDALSELHETLVDEWTGTLDKPGAMLKIVLAGMTAGNDALTEGVSPKPGKAVALDIDWSLMSEEALEFVKRYLFKLIKGIDQTTAELVQKAVAEWVKTGGTLDELTAAIEPIFRDRTRAEAISSTESTRLFYEGSNERWKQAGVKKVKWRTTADSLVCSICRALNGTIGTIEDGWKSGGKVYRPPAHVRCRCWGVPVVE